MKTISMGEVIPLGLSKGTGTFNIRVPLWLKNARRYDILSDEFVTGRWMLSMLLRFSRNHFVASWGWSVSAKGK